MRIVLLAAGRGDRANSANYNLPKVLLKGNNGKSLLIQNLENISDSQINAEVNLVVGFLHNKIREEVESYKKDHRNTKISLLYNVDYEKGVLTSLFVGLRDVEEDVLIINGDTYYSHFIWDKLVSIRQSTLLVSQPKAILDSVRVLTKGERIIKVGKKINNFNFISSGCLFLTLNHVKMIRTLIFDHISKSKFFIWHNLINYLIEKDEIISYKIVSPDNYFEIDTREDYEKYLLFQDSNN